jgi:hypothetical protein
MFWKLSLLLILALAGSGRAPETQGKTAMLAVIEADGNLAVYDAAGKNPIPITTDAVPGEKIYQWPTWSSDGRLAFFGANPGNDADPYTLRVFMLDTVKAGAVPQVAYTSTDEIFTYPYWSPAGCSATCRDLALLYTPPAGVGLGLRMILQPRRRAGRAVLLQLLARWQADGVVTLRAADRTLRCGGRPVAPFAGCTGEVQRADVVAAG